jgi:putative spermidine/putrescine transport system permease protein
VDRVLSLSYRAGVVLVFVFMLLPMAVVVLASISPTDRIELAPDHISLRWYLEVLQPRWIGAMQLSLLLAAAVAVVSTLLGGLGAFAVAYYRCPANSVVSVLLLSPLAAPQVVKGIALLQFLSLVGLMRALGPTALVLGHVMVMLPFAARMIMNGLHALDRDLERAAVILGANRWRVLWHIVLPLAKPGIFGALAFSFVLSFNNVEISLFLSQAGSRTLPIEVVNYMGYRIDPALAAVNVVTLVLVLLVVLTLDRVGGFSKVLQAGVKR